MAIAVEIHAAGSSTVCQVEVDPGTTIPVGPILPPDPAATHATFESRAGDYRASIPLDVVASKGILENDASGGLRLRVVDGDTLCWNVKDVARIRLTVGPEPDSVPENPSH